MTTVERGRLRIAAGRALRCFPDPVGRTLANELNSWEAQSLPLGAKMEALIEAIMNTKLP